MGRRRRCGHLWQCSWFRPGLPDPGVDRARSPMSSVPLSSTTRPSAGMCSPLAAALKPRRLMGLPVDRTIFMVYLISGGMAGTGRRHPCGTVWCGPAHRGRWLGTLRHRLGRGRRHPAHRRQRLDWRHAGRRTSCSASSSPFSTSRTAWAGFHSRPIGSRWCAASSCSSLWCCRPSCRDAMAA